MRNRILMFVVTTSMFALVGGASAYAMLYNARLEVNIPFEFTVNNQTLPAGEYEVSAPNNGTDLNLLEIRQVNGNRAMFFQTFDTEPAARPVQTGLVFDRIGGRDFLSQVWMVGSDKGNELEKSKQELQHIALVPRSSRRRPWGLRGRQA
jgi:hypothetical protein